MGAFGEDIARLVGLDPRDEQLTVRVMANGEEEPVNSNVVVALVGKSAPVDDVRAFHSIRTEESFGVRFEQDFDFGVRHDLLLHRF